MLKHLSFLLLAGVTSAAIVAVAQQPAPTTTIKSIPIRQTSPTSGSQMYSTYCAVCHGADGKGNGPAAAALKTPAPDLTMLSKRNGGAYPESHVVTVLQMGAEDPAHGTAEMPIWGDLMKTLSPQNSAVVVHQRIANLSDYLKKMQQ
jgi:mono/diheme cytochrome c family protein